MELLWVSLASFLTGFIDSIVGGGGLVLVPTLFTGLSEVLIACAIGGSIGITPLAPWERGWG